MDERSRNNPLDTPKGARKVNDARYEKNLKLIDDWNREHPGGTLVTWREGGRVRHARTRGEAYLALGVPAIFVEDRKRPLLLAKLTVRGGPPVPADGADGAVGRAS